MPNTVRRAFYGPSNWLVAKFNAEQRRAFAFWLVVFSVIFAVPFGGEVFYVTLLSLFALFSNYTAETPVEKQ